MKEKSANEPMTALNKLLVTDLDAAEVIVCLASVEEDDETPLYMRLQLSGDLTEEFRSVVKAIFEIKQGALESGDLQVREYSPGSKPDDNEIEHIDLSSQRFIKVQIESLDSPENLIVFKADDEYISHLRFHTIILRPQKGRPVFCFRSYSPKKELGRSKVFGALLSDGQFDRIREPVFLFDRSLDCISCGDDMFILSKDKFQKVFRFFEMVLKSAEKVLIKIQQNVPVANFDEFADTCKGHLQKLSKLNNIASKPYLSRLTIDDMKKVIKKKQLNVKVVKKGRKEMLLFDSSDKWALLKLLDDDYLDSMMTGLSYEVNSKREMA